MIVLLVLLSIIFSNKLVDRAAIILEPIDEFNQVPSQYNQQEPDQGYKQQINQNNTKQPPERCYIITSSLHMNAESIMSDLKSIPNNIKYIYKQNIMGFTFCSNNKEVIEKIKSRSGIINVEEDKLFRIGSVENDKALSKKKSTVFKANGEVGKVNLSKEDLVTKPATRRDEISSKTQSTIPLYFYRLKNMGNLFFNNYILDNIVFRILRINKLIKFFYSYNYFYTGKGVQITTVDSECNNQSKIITRLLAGPEAIAKKSSIVVLNDVNCDGTIWLSKLLYSLEKIDSTDILFLPLSGPHSDSLDTALSRLGNRAVIVTAAGNNGNLSCSYSPNGFSVIKVGSVDKHGIISKFSNRGECNRIYALGEGHFGGNGTSYSAAIVASSIAMFLQKHPEASYQNVMEYLSNNSMNNHRLYTIFQLPDLKPGSEEQRSLTYYDFIEVMIFLIFLIGAILIISYLAYKAIKKYRRRQADDLFILEPLQNTNTRR